jgi:putative cell wall binding repeat protein
MRAAPSRLLGATLALAVAALTLGCGKSQLSRPAQGGPTGRLAPLAAPGAVSVATRNTTRLGGADVSTDAAAVARAVYPGLTPASRPQAVVLVNSRDWPAALAASALAGAPLGAPILYSDANTLPAVSIQALQALHPLGASSLGGTQVVRIGTSAAVPNGYLTRTLASGEPAATAASVEQLLLDADGGRAPRQVIVLAAEDEHALQMPAAGLAAESGAPILFVTRARLPPATAGVLAALHRPAIYVVDASGVGRHTLGELSHFGRVTSITGAARGSEAEPAVANAIAVARFTDGSFGWGIKEPGHGLVLANATRPLDAPASAPLSATGDYAPLLLLTGAEQVPPALASYLGDIQPAYTAATPAVRGFYNHGWLIGDESAASATTQAEIDSLLEISPRKASPEDASGTPAE